MVGGICNIHNARAINGHCVGVLKTCCTTLAVHAAAAPGLPGQGGHIARRNLAHGVVGRISYVQIPGTVNSDRRRCVEQGRGGGSIGTAWLRRNPRSSLETRKSRNRPGRRHAVNNMIAVVGDIERAGAIHNDASWRAQLAVSAIDKCRDNASGRYFANRPVAGIGDKQIA